MKYRLTPLNILVGLSVGLAIWLSFNPGPEGWGFLLIFPLIAVGLISFIIDFFLQKHSDKYIRTFLIEFGIIIIVSLIYFLPKITEQTKTLILPDKLESEFVVIIYGVTSAPKLSLDAQIKIPVDGILITSTKIDDDGRQTVILTNSGLKLNTDSVDLQFGELSGGQIKCEQNIYKFKSWLVQKSCCLYSNKDIDSLQIKIQNYFCGQHIR